MIKRIGCALVVAFLCVSAASAQTVRFDTNVGTFDMDLNPTGNVNLQGHVDNILAYVNGGRYNGVVLNRAAENFVLQMAGFLTDSSTLPSDFSGFSRVGSLGNVIVDADLDGVADFDLAGFDNTRGTVSLALSGPLNSGTSSFFINVGDNTASLNPQGFIPFATVTDLATIDLIMSVDQTFLVDPGAPASDLDANGASTASRDIPIIGSDGLIFVERTFVVPDAVMGPIAPLAANAMPGDGFPPSPPPPPPAVQALSVPEPPALVIAVGAIMLLAALKRGKIA